MALFGGGLGSKGALVIERKQTCLLGYFIVGYFFFHTETSMLSAHLKLSESGGESSETKGKLSEVQGKPAASEVQGKLSSEVKGESSEMNGELSEVDGKPSEVKGKQSEVDGKLSEVQDKLEGTLSLTPVGSFKMHIPITVSPQPKPIALLGPLAIPRANISALGRTHAARSDSFASWQV